MKLPIIPSGSIRKQCWVTQPRFGYFLKRHINILSFTTSQSEIPDVFRFVIVESPKKKLGAATEKQVDVIKAFYHTEETIFQESALYV